VSKVTTVVAQDAPAVVPVARKRRVVRIEAGYNGARSDRPALARWSPGSGSADHDSLSDLPTLRGRARDLVRNNPLAAGAISTVVTNAVGTGLAVQPQIDREYLGLDEKEADEWERQAERLFWAAADSLDIERTLDFAGLQDLVLRSTLESGDIFTIRRFLVRPGDVIGLKLQLVEGDRVCNPHFRMDSRQIRGGIERDRHGAPLACHILESHPGDHFLGTFQEWKRVPVYGPSGDRQVLHHYRKLRPGLSRGVPYLASVVELFLQLGRYSEAEITAAVVNALFTAFVTTKGDEDSTALQSLHDEDDGTDEATEVVLGNGLVADLAPGEDIKFADPSRPNVNFGEFAKAVLQQIGVGLELPFEVLVKHFNSSYSASRAALLDAYKFFLGRRVWVASSFCQPVYEMVISEGVARGYLEAPGFFTDPLARRAWLDAAWIGDSPGQIDPLKEVKAAESRVRIGVSTLEEETASLTGGSWERKHEQRVKEVRMRREGGLDQEPEAERVVTESSSKQVKDEEEEED
jgi:lambda family phage portal protein